MNVYAAPFKATQLFNWNFRVSLQDLYS